MLNSFPDNQCNGIANAGKTLSAGGTLNVVVSGGTVPSGAIAAVLNVTVVNPEAQGYVTVYPEGGSQPLTSNLNYTMGEVTSNRVMVPLSAGGEITVFSSQATDVVIDVSGYFSAAGGTGSEFTPEISPVRVCDTRPDNPSGLSFPESQCNGAGNVGEPIGPAGTDNVVVTGMGGVPANATAVVANVTAVDPVQTPQTFLTIYPAPPRPTVSDLNVSEGVTRANLAVATTTSSSVTIYNSTGSVNVLVDMFGWYSQQ